jgi:acetolactate synthase I/III small subunit
MTEPKELSRPAYKPTHHTLSVLVENKFGVLARVTTLISRRGYNIFSLAVAPTEDDLVSRITIVIDADSQPMEQIVKQLDKLINVLAIRELTPGTSVERELLLMTVSADATKRAEIAELVNIFDAKVVNVGTNAMTIALSDPPEKLDDFEDLMRPYGILEVQRSGRLALPRLPRNHGGSSEA